MESRFKIGDTFYHVGNDQQGFCVIESVLTSYTVKFDSVTYHTRGGSEITEYVGEDQAAYNTQEEAIKHYREGREKQIDLLRESLDREIYPIRKEVSLSDSIVE